MSSEGRSRRSVSKRVTERHETLSKLASLRGSKHKYELTEEEAVYDEVDQEEYASLVSKRQRDDWIVDDDGSGYAEHGREIFDDEYEQEEYDEDGGPSKSGKKSNKYKLQSARAKQASMEPPKGDIRNLFSSMSRSSASSKMSSMGKSEYRSSGAGAKKSMNDVEIDTDAIDSLVEATLKPKPIKDGFLTPQPLKLKKKGQTPTITSYGSAQTALKRKSFTPGSASTSTASPRNLFAGPPLKKRVLEFNFDDIVDQEVQKTVDSKKENTNSKSSTTPKPKALVKDEPMDDDDDMDNDFMLPDNSAYDDIDFDDVKPDAKKLGALKGSKSGAQSKLEEEEWVSCTASSSNGQANNSEPTHNFLPEEIAFEKDDEGNKLIHFFWFDAFTDQNRNTDAVYLFGKVWVEKVKKFASASVCIKNVERSVFLLPRERFLDDKTRKVALTDVYEEFKERVAPKLKIAEFRSRKVTKKYAFELANIPAVGEYLEVKYSGAFQPLPPAYHTGNTYRHVFGSNASILENLILTLNLSGPQWLVLKNPTITPRESLITWCKFELSVNGQTQVSVEEASQRPAPDFTLLSLNFKTFNNTETRQNEIVAISCLVNRSFKFEQTGSGSSNQILKPDPSAQPAGKYDSHFCMITRPSAKTGVQLPIDFTPKMALKDYRKTTLNVLSSERELLNCFLAKFQQLDADIVVGHDVFAFDYDLLLSRFAHFKVQNLWSKLGRIRRSGLPIRTKDKHLLAGRLICDVKILARELIRAKSYDLTELAATILKKGRFEIEQALLPNYYTSSSQLLRLVDLMMRDNELTLSIMYELNCLPLVKQITNIAGNLLSRTLLGGRAERNEYLLLHAFHEKGYIVPDKAVRFGKDSGGKGGPSKTVAAKAEVPEEAEEEEEGDEEGAGGKKKVTLSKAAAAAAAKASSSYVGGLVLEPKVGFYDKFILLMDFNSLYPSIIQEYNICFTTVKLNGDGENSSNTSPETIAHQLLDCEEGKMAKEEGILPTEIRKLVESRREVKRALCDPSLSPEERNQLDIKQKALKITANSMYGCLGFAASRFYAKHLAALITYKGREILTHTKELVERIGYEVIYGDTDSIMILTNCLKYEEVRETGRRIQTEVNRKYKLLEIEIDGVFRCMLLLKKKKYAALTVQNGPKGSGQTFQREIKGLDIVRRDWSMIAKIAGEAVLDQILVPDKPIRTIVDGIHVYLKTLADELRAGQRPLEDFVINKALTKKPEEYAEGKGLTHVTVALRYNANNLGKPIRAGDTVPYIVCLDGTNSAATQRGYHLEEVRANVDGKLSIDTTYYLAQQLLPVVSRLCEPLDGTDSAIIAEFLGVESVASVKRSAAAAVQLELDPALNAGERKYDVCKSVHFKCPPAPIGCGRAFEFRDLFPVWAKYKALKSDPANKGNIAKQMAEDPDLFKSVMSGCEGCGARFSGPNFQLFFELQLRAQVTDFVNKFYRKEMYCDDQACAYVTRCPGGRMNGKNRLACGKCKHGSLQLEMSEHLLFQQLNFFVHIFDLDTSLARFSSLELSKEQKAEKKMLESTYGPLFATLQKAVQGYLDQSSYNEFDLGVLFRKFRYGGSQQSSK